MGRPKTSQFTRQLRAAISDNLQKLMGGMTQAALSDKTGIPASTISGYIARRSTPDPDQVQKLADAFGVQKSDIDPRFAASVDSALAVTTGSVDAYQMRLSKAYYSLNSDGRQKVADYAEDLHKSGNYAREDSGLPFAEEAAQYVAVIGSAAAGAGFAYADDVERLVTAVSAPPHDFAIDVKGDSMFPTIFDGDVAFVVKACDKIDRQIYVLDIDGETVIKRCVFEPDALELISDNPDWSSRRITGCELESTRLLGRVVGWQSGV